MWNEKKKGEKHKKIEEAIWCATISDQVFVRRVRTSVGVAKMNFQRAAVGRCFKRKQPMTDLYAICRPLCYYRVITNNVADKAFIAKNSVISVYICLRSHLYLFFNIFSGLWCLLGVCLYILYVSQTAGFVEAYAGWWNKPARVSETTRPRVS